MNKLRDNISELIKIASENTGSQHATYNSEISKELMELLNKRDGFFAFESALEVFSVTYREELYSTIEWNEKSLWKFSYGKLAPEGVCFAQDIFGCQFVMDRGIHSFDPETGELTYISETIFDWAGKILDEYDSLTGYKIAHDWQKIYGNIPKKMRLIPIVPFVLGGEFELRNLVAMDMVKGMTLRGSLACQLVDLPDGATVDYVVVE